ncbi:MAG: hypothetical protein ABI336_09535 [Humibacillus sp.]
MIRTSTPFSAVSNTPTPMSITVRTATALRGLVLSWSWPDLVIWWPRMHTP